MDGYYKSELDATVLRVLGDMPGSTAYDLRSNYPGFYATTRGISQSLLRLYRRGKLTRSVGVVAGREVYLYEVAKG